MTFLRSIFQLLIFLGLPLFAGTCLAALGDAPGASDETRHFATPAGADYSVQTTSRANGVVVHEYVAAGGRVFALAWAGPFMPDLRELLGSHFDVFVAETARLPMAGRSQVVIQRPDLMLFSGGHMRAFTGRAWLPAMLPAGFDPAGIH